MSLYHPLWVNMRHHLSKDRSLEELREWFLKLKTKMALTKFVDRILMTFWKLPKFFTRVLTAKSSIQKTQLSLSDLIMKLKKSTESSIWTSYSKNSKHLWGKLDWIGLSLAGLWHRSLRKDREEKRLIETIKSLFRLCKIVKPYRLVGKSCQSQGIHWVRQLCWHIGMEDTAIRDALLR